MTPADSWLAVHVLAKHEFSVGMMLGYKGYEYFIPTYKVGRKWSDRTKIIEMPLFPCYVFCRSHGKQNGSIVTTAGVRQIVGSGGKPCIVPDSEINALQQIVASKLAMSPYPCIKIGQRVEVTEGPLVGIRGTVVRINNRRRLIVSVEVVMRSVMIDIGTVKVCSDTNSNDSNVCGDLGHLPARA